MIDYKAEDQRQGTVLCLFKSLPQNSGSKKAKTGDGSLSLTLDKKRKIGDKKIKTENRPLSLRELSHVFGCKDREPSPVFGV